MKTHPLLIGFLTLVALVYTAEAGDAANELPEKAAAEDGALPRATETSDTTPVSPLRPETSETTPGAPIAVDLGPAADESKTVIVAGARFLRVRLLSDTKGEPGVNSFIGSINKLEEDSQFVMLRPYIQVLLTHHLGLGLSYDYLETKTIDPGGGDGNVQTTSFFFYLTLEYPNTTRWTPYAELGLGKHRNAFDPRPTWSQGGRRRFDLENSVEPFLGVGCRLAVWRALSLDAYVRYTNSDVKGVYIFTGDKRLPQPFTFTLEHISSGIGVSWRF